jgi:hypothetical protein
MIVGVKKVLSDVVECCYTIKIEVKYLDVHLDRRLTCAKPIKTKTKQLKLKAKQLHWILGRSTLSIEIELILTQSSAQTHLDLGYSAMRVQPEIPELK